MDLRFRDDKDLDELISYGFKYCDTVGQYHFNERNEGGLTYIYINKWNRKVVYRQDIPGNCRCLMKYMI